MRRARCSYYKTCKHEVDSVPDLAFFESLDANSREAKEFCICGFTEGAHQKHPRIKCKSFSPRGAAEHDRYYCGCWGFNCERRMV